MLTAGSLFSGIDGFGLALERCGVPTLWASEIDRQAISVHERHFPRTVQLGDVKNVGKHNAAPVTFIVGGSPCQNFSQAGDRTGLDGQESRLFHEYIRVVGELRPAFAIWENVPGALSSNSGRDFAAVIAAFYECGARDIAWRTLDAQFAGVPQRRRRIFLVADFRGSCAGEILFEREGAYRDCSPSGTPGADIAYALTTSNQRYDAKNQETFIGVTAYDARNNKLTGGLAATLQTQGRTVNQTPLIAGTLKANKGRGWANAVANPGDYLVPEKAGTLRAGSAGRRFQEGNYGDSLVNHSHRVRRLMPVECERLQGFPDGWTRWGANNEEMSDTARYRMLGNSVAVPVVEWIIRRMVEMM